MEHFGIVRVKGKEIDLGRNRKVVKSIKTLSQFGLITFSRTIRFKSTEYVVSFFKPVTEMKNMYNLGNELLIVCCPDGMNDFKSRTKDFIDYMLITNNEFKNRLDKVTCFLVDGDLEIVNKVKEDRIENPDSRLIVPFSISELNETFTKIQLSNRMNEIYLV